MPSLIEALALLLMMLTVIVIGVGPLYAAYCMNTNPDIVSGQPPRKTDRSPR
jgi:hypothetical protein